jgi:hypothetical protein
MYKALGILACTLAAMGCDVDVKDEGKLPEVDVKAGRMPDVDVRGPDVDVRMEEKKVTVPDIDIKTKETTITVPDVDLKVPKENENK